MSTAVIRLLRRVPSLRHAVRWGLTGALLAGLAGCHDDDDHYYPPYNVPNSVGIVDMDGDGRNDVVSAFTHVDGSYPNRGYASVILQSPTPAAAGTFLRGVDSVIGFNPATLAIDNIDNVGGADFAVANANSGTVSVLLQSGTTGVIGSINTLNVGGAPFDVALGQLDNNGLTDVVVANATRSSVSVFYQETATPGTFAAPILLDVGNLSTAAAIGDLDGDGFNDVVVANQDPGGNAGRVSIFYSTTNTPPVTFATRVDLPVGTEPIAVKIADANGDGFADLIIANEGGGSWGLGTSGVTVILQDPMGVRTFLAPTTYATARGTVAVAIGDVNGDGRVDLVTANRGGSWTGTVSVLMQSSAVGAEGVFLSAVNYVGDCVPLGIAIGDLNGDAIPDIAVADGNRATVMFNSATTPGLFAAAVRIGD
jgi:hypothetical protein